MITKVPDYLDPFLFANQKRLFQGQWDLSKFERLAPLLADTNGRVEYNLEFGIDHKNIHYLRGDLNACLNMSCQRCLDTMTQAVHVPIALCFVDEWNAIDNLPKTYEPLVVEILPISLIDIIEDEILLALPQVVLHKQQCGSRYFPKADTTNLASDKKDLGNHSTSTNAFSVLAQLDIKE